MCFPRFWRLQGDLRGAKLRPRWAKLRPRRAKIEPRWGKNEAKRDKKSRPKGIQSRNRMLIALERPPRGSRGSTLRNFRRVLGGILATNREPNASFEEHFQPKVKQKCIRKQESENVAKMTPRGSKKKPFWRSFGQLCPPKGTLKQKGLKRTKH